MSEPLTHEPFHHRDHLDHDAFLAEVRDLNASGPRIGWAWQITATDPDHPDDTVTLCIGVHHDTGVLSWDDQAGILVPGTGCDPTTDYRLAGLHPARLDPGTEVPVDTALAALQQFLRASRRPTRLSWHEPAPTTSEAHAPRPR